MLSWQRFLAVGVFLVVAALYYRETQRVSKVGPSSWYSDPRADCGVVLTGGSGRVRAGIDLLYRGLVKKLIISGVNPGSRLREIMPNLIFYGGLDERNIILERRSATTYGNAAQSETLVSALRCRSVVLVTSTLHMHRALKTFRGVMPREIEVLPYAVVSGALLPNWYDLGLESLKSLFYSIFAY